MDLYGNIKLDSITDQELADIKGIAKEMLDSGQFGSDQFRIALLAFLVWCGESGTEIQVLDHDDDDKGGRTFH